MGPSFQISQRGETLVLLLCLALSLTLIVLPNQTRIVVADRLGSVLTAPYWGVRNFIQDVLDTQDENARLRRDLAVQELMLANQLRMQNDADRLAGPALDPGYQGDLVACQVIQRQRSRFATMIKIHSLVPVNWRPWQPVVSRAGYLGRLRTVINDREAWVELLASPDFSLGVEIERTGLLGILRPRAERFVIEMVGRDEDVQVGDDVITSGIAEISEGQDDPWGTALTPRGFPVGRVVQVRSPADMVFKEIVVQPAANFDYNETVFVVTPLAGGSSPSGEQGRGP